MSKNITPRNEQDERHGYWETYYSNGKLHYKGDYINDKREGYFIEYWDNAYHKFYYKNGNRYYKNRCIYYGFESF